MHLEVLVVQLGFNQTLFLIFLYISELSRRWFLIHNGQLLYMKRNNENSQQQSSCSTMIPDLRLCTIRLSNDHERRFVFEIISPNR